MMKKRNRITRKRHDEDMKWRGESKASRGVE